jgi:hypothetical protein
MVKFYSDNYLRQNTLDIIYPSLGSPIDFIIVSFFHLCSSIDLIIVLFFRLGSP